MTNQIKDTNIILEQNLELLENITMKYFKDLELLLNSIQIKRNTKRKVMRYNKTLYLNNKKLTLESENMISNTEEIQIIDVKQNKIKQKFSPTMIINIIGIILMLMIIFTIYYFKMR